MLALQAVQSDLHSCSQDGRHGATDRSCVDYGQRRIPFITAQLQFLQPRIARPFLLHRVARPPQRVPFILYPRDDAQRRRRSLRRRERGACNSKRWFSRAFCEIQDTTPLNAGPARSNCVQSDHGTPCKRCDRNAEIPCTHFRRVEPLPRSVV